MITDDGLDLYCRRILVKLEQPIQDGETEIALLTNLPLQDASSLLVAQLPRKRWRVATLFHTKSAS